jgi:hypothetical protein
MDREMNFNIRDVERDPKTFFVERLREQARMEGSSLSEDEDEYLELARTGKDEEASAVLKKFRKQKKFRELDEHLSGLMNRAYDMDITSSTEGREFYRRATTALADVDTQPHLSMFVSQITFDDRFDEGLPNAQFRRGLTRWIIAAGVLALGWWIATRLHK